MVFSIRPALPLGGTVVEVPKEVKKGGCASVEYRWSEPGNRMLVGLKLRFRQPSERKRPEQGRKLPLYKPLNLPLVLLPPRGSNC